MKTSRAQTNTHVTNIQHHPHINTHTTNAYHLPPTPDSTPSTLSYNQPILTHLFCAV